MKQPLLGIVSTVLVTAISLGFISIFSAAAFTTWVAYLLICLVPSVLIITVTWRGEHPAFAAVRPQPARGGLLLVLAVAAGAVVAAAHFLTVGGRVSPPTPVLSMCIIASVNVAFWMAIIWGGWPFVALRLHPVAMGVSMLAALYAVNQALFWLLFDFGFLRGALAPAAAIGPRGLFDAWHILVFQVTAISAMFLILCFELWPLSLRPALTRQPALGAIWTAVVLCLAVIAAFIGERVLGLDAPVFMVRGPIPFIFGAIVVLNMLQDSLFKRFRQPWKGILNALCAAGVGVALARLFGALAPLVSGRIPSGAPAYTFEIWLASALLAVTFPFLIFFAELFQFWPLGHPARAAAEKVARASSRPAGGGAA